MIRNDNPDGFFQEIPVRFSQPEVPQHLTDYAARLRAEIYENQRFGRTHDRIQPLRDELRRVEEAITQIVARHNPSITLGAYPVRFHRLHLRKQSDGSWAAHWLRVEDGEPEDIAMPNAERFAELMIKGRVPIFDIWDSRESMLSGLPGFLEECLKRQRTQATITDYLRRDTEETLLRRTTHGNREPCE